MPLGIRLSQTPARFILSGARITRRGFLALKQGPINAGERIFG
jgi:hypothetical protein